MNREVPQNQHTHGFLRLKTKTSFKNFTKHITYNPFYKKKERNRDRVENTTCKKKTSKTTTLIKVI